MSTTPLPLPTDQQQQQTVPLVPPPQAPPSAIQGSINAGQTTPPETPQLPPRPVGTSGAGQPVSKQEFFRDMLGKFFYAVGTGLANRGSGPDADARGAGAALTALPNRDIMQQQLEISRQNAQGMAAYHQAQATALQNRYKPATFIDDQGNPQQLSADEFAKLMAARTANQGKVDVQNLKNTGNVATQETKNEGAANVAKINTGSKEKIAAANLSEKVAEFQKTDDYKRWKTQQDNETKKQVADLMQSKAPAALLQTAVFAKGGLDRLDDADAAMKRLEAKGVFASNVAQNKVEDWIFGKGLVDPSLDAETRQDIGKMRAALGYTSSAAMRAHTGRTSQEIYEDFKKRLGAGQDWSALRGAMDETRSMLGDYATSASNANIKAIRGGTNVKAPAAGEYDFVNGQLVPRKPK
jgi:hypothetical protein